MIRENYQKCTRGGDAHHLHHAPDPDHLQQSTGGGGIEEEFLQSEVTKNMDGLIVVTNVGMVHHPDPPVGTKVLVKHRPVLESLVGSPGNSFSLIYLLFLVMLFYFNIITFILFSFN